MQAKNVGPFYQVSELRWSERDYRRKAAAARVSRTCTGRGTGAEKKHFDPTISHRQKHFSLSSGIWKSSVVDRNCRLVDEVSAEEEPFYKEINI